MTLNADVFERDPRRQNLPNGGVSQVGLPQDDNQWEVLRFELSTFVCEGEYRKGLERILSSFVRNLGQPTQDAAWVSGFFGSGKSHLVRILDALWRDLSFPSGARARSLVPDLPQDIQDLLKELGTAATQAGGIWSAAGKLGAGTESLRLSLLGVVLRAAELPEQYQQANFVLWLEKENIRGAVEEALRQRDTSLSDELHYMHISPPLAESLLQVRPDLASNPAAVHELLKVQFPYSDDITNQQFLDMLEQVLRRYSTKPGIPLTLLVFDETEQFLGGRRDFIDELLTLIESITTRFESRLLVVATGQSAMGSNTELDRMRDRFRLRVELSDSDIDSVVRRVVLKKTPTGRGQVGAVVNQVRGEIDSHIPGSAIAPRASDESDLVPDYPLLPSRRRFWEYFLHGVDKAGRSGLRTQLRAVHDSLSRIADEPLGTVIATDLLYDQQRADMLKSSILDSATRDLIDTLEREDGDGPLKARLAKLIFLIGRMEREGRYAPELRADAATLAHLLVEDLTNGSAELRSRVPVLLEEMANSGQLTPLDSGEYAIQTVEGREWTDDYKRRRRNIGADGSRVQHERTERLRRAIGEAVRSALRLTQGRSKAVRRVVVHFGDQAPDQTGPDIPVWIRDGWSTSQATVEGDATAAGPDSPVVFAFIPQRHASDIQDRLVSAMARREVLDSRPISNSEAGEQARDSMEVSYKADDRRIAQLLDDVLGDSLVLLGGGAVASGATLADKVQEAAAKAVERKFPRFGTGDDPRWPIVIRRVNGNEPNPLGALDYNGEARDHPVCREILTWLGNGSQKVNDVRKAFRDSPYGWEQDTVDGALLSLVIAGQIVISRDGNHVNPRQVAQSALGPCDIRAEAETLTTLERIELRKWLREVTGTEPRTGEEVEIAHRVLDDMIALADRAGGNDPLPSRPDTGDIRELRQQTGNQLLRRTYDRREELAALRGEWSRLADLARVRSAEWEQLERLLALADGLPVVEETKADRMAIRDARSLLYEPNPVTSVTSKVTGALRAALTEHVDALQSEVQRAVAQLEALPEWTQLNEAQRGRVLQESRLMAPQRPPLGNTDELVASLDAVPLTTWAERCAAVPGHLQKAQEAVAQLLEPEVRRVNLPNATLRTKDDVHDYVQKLESLLTGEVDQGPIIV